MSVTLYLLRQQPERISPSLLEVSDKNADIVCLEQLISPSSIQSGLLSDDDRPVPVSRRTLTYDDLVEKIFSSERIIVL
jgi:hypothetical protein